MKTMEKGGCFSERSSRLGVSVPPDQATHNPPCFSSRCRKVVAKPPTVGSTRLLPASWRIRKGARLETTTKRPTRFGCNPSLCISNNRAVGTTSNEWGRLSTHRSRVLRTAFARPEREKLAISEHPSTRSSGRPLRRAARGAALRKGLREKLIVEL